MTMTNKKDYYAILQISSNATAEEIKLSFRRLARQYHPDLNPNNPETADKFKQISEAYDILSDVTKRRRYDRDRRLTNNYTKRKSSYKTNVNQQPEPGERSQNAQDFFLRGMEQSKGKQYQKAVKEYSKAIELDPSFIDAYLKRCEMRYKLGDNQGVLDDCYRVIQISPTVPKAYYYQGRARFSLGYVQAAIDSYSEAIRQEKNYAQAYYYRGIAYQDLKDNLLALEDWQVAAELFRTEGNYGAYRLTKKKMNAISNGVFNFIYTFSQLGDLLNNALLTLIAYLFNPVGGLLPAYARLSSAQAFGVGLIYAIGADFCLTGGNYLLIGTVNPFLPQNITFNLTEIVFINFLPFICLIVLSSLVRLINNIRSNLAQDFFLAGTSLLPVTLSILIIGFIASPPGIPMIPVLTLIAFGFSYSILTLYSNCTQILGISEAKASFFTPLMGAVSLAFYYFSKNLFLS